MAMSEIWYAYALIGNRVVGNIAVEKMVIGKKSRHELMVSFKKYYNNLTQKSH
jgi:hypothetical protein